MSFPANAFLMANPPPFSWGNILHHMGKFGNISFSSEGFPTMQIPVHPYMEGVIILLVKVIVSIKTHLGLCSLI